MSYILDNKDFLNKNGYLIIQDKNVKEICNKVYDKIKIESNKARFIFNGKTNDKKRKQCVLNSKSAIIIISLQKRRCTHLLSSICTLIKVIVRESNTRLSKRFVRRIHIIKRLMLIM